MDQNKDIGVPISQSIVANVQLGLPSTVSKLSNKMRFIDKIAPILKDGGVIRNIDIIKPITIRSSGISACNRTTNAFGGILYVAGAVRQDILIKEGSILGAIRFYKDQTGVGLRDAKRFIDDLREKIKSND